MFVDRDTKANSKSIDPPYPVHGGLFRQDAIMLLRRFYIRENEKGIQLKLSAVYIRRTTHFEIAPEPRPKKNRVLKVDLPSANESAFSSASTL